MTDERSRRALLRAGAGLSSPLLAGCVVPRPGGDGTPASRGTPVHDGRGTPRHDGTRHRGRHGGPPRTAGDGEASVGEWMADVGNFSGVVDLTGRTAVTVRVGARGSGGYYAFDPPAVRVSLGTTVSWEWTGDGGGHDAVARDGSFASDLTAAADATSRYTLDAAGTVPYYCTPHRSLGMKGVVVVA